MQPWSYNNSRRLGFASAIHRIYTPHDSTDMDPCYDQLIRAAKYRFIYKYLGFLRWAVRLRDCHRRKTSSQVRERVTTVPWLHDNTWNFIVSKIKRDCCGKYIYSWPQFSFFGLLLKSCIHLHYSEHRRLEVMYFVQTDRHTSSRAQHARHHRQSLVLFHVILSVYYQVLILLLSSDFIRQLRHSYLLWNITCDDYN